MLDCLRLILICVVPYPCRLRSADVLFRLAGLTHLGLSYNTISSFPSLGILSCCPLVSLDLSQNDLEDLGATLQCLSAMPRLKNLSLKGNPLSLMPAYPAVIPDALPRLLYLDGAKLVQPMVAVTKPDPQAVIRDICDEAAANGPPHLPLQLTLNDLWVAEAASIMGTLYPQPPEPGSAQGSPAGSPAPEPMAAPEPKAVFHHFELQLADGTPLSSVARKICTPEEMAAAEGGCRRRLLHLTFPVCRRFLALEQDWVLAWAA